MQYKSILSSPPHWNVLLWWAVVCEEHCWTSIQGLDSIVYMLCHPSDLYLDLVPDMSTPTFIRSFKRLSARRGLPQPRLSVVWSPTLKFRSTSKDLALSGGSTFPGRHGGEGFSSDYSSLN